MAFDRNLARDLVIDRMRDAVLVVDADGYIVECNRAGDDLLAAAEEPDRGRDEHVSRYPALAPLVHEPVPEGGDGPEIVLDERTYSSSVFALGEGEARGRAIVLQDVTRRVQAERLLQTFATTDELTRIPNRRQFLDLARRLVAQAQRSRTQLAWLVMDVDDFKDVNERYGRSVGDIVLQSVGAIASASVRGGDVLGRIGGDEFALCLPDTGSGGAWIVAERLRNLVENLSVSVPDGFVQVTVSIGVYLPDEPDSDVEACLERAEAARDGAKGAGGDRVQIYRADGAG